MQMTKNVVNNEATNQYSFWSYCLAIVSVFAIADVLTGGLIRESFVLTNVEFTLGVFAMIVTVGVFGLDGPPNMKFVRSYSRHKL